MIEVSFNQDVVKLCYKQGIDQTSFIFSESSNLSKTLKTYPLDSIEDVALLKILGLTEQNSTSFTVFKQLFNIDQVKNFASNLSFHGGRGQTALFSIDHNSIEGTLLSNIISEASIKEQNINSCGHNDKTWLKDNLKQEQQRYQVCLRHYLRGGLIGKLVHNSFFKFSKTSKRAYDEFVMLNRMHQANLPVPKPVLAQEIESCLFIKNAIIIEKLPCTRNLAEIIENRSLSKEECTIIGKTLADFFKFKVLHTDLNIRNILLDEQGRCFVIDFDKCAILDYLSKAQVNSMLDRLERSFQKECKLAKLKSTNLTKHIYYQDNIIEQIKAQVLFNLK